MKALLDSDWLPVLGESLLHSLWQGVVLWGLLLTIFAWLKGLSFKSKHHCAVATLSLLVFCPVATGLFGLIAVEEKRLPSPDIIEALTFPERELRYSGGEVITSVPQMAEALEPRVAERIWAGEQKYWLRWVAMTWMAGLLLMGMRWLAGWWWLRRIKEGAEIPDESMHMTMQRCQLLSGFDRGVLRVAQHLGIPLVIGWMKPVVYFPASLISRLTADELDALLLHELAHLKRSDPRWQAWVTVAETLLFFNPAAWSLAKIAREAAEHACDDLVLEWQGKRMSYARALAAVEEWRGKGLVLAASGSGLQLRIRRILGLPVEPLRNTLRHQYGVTALIGLVSFLVICSYSVPVLARVLSDTERVAVIHEREKEWGVADELNPKPLTAVGAVKAADGVTLPNTITMVAMSKNYVAYSNEIPLKPITLEGKGEGMTVAAWGEGFAPSWCDATPRDPKTGNAAFDLVLEKGFPATVQVVDEQGRPVMGAKVNSAVVIREGLVYGHQDFTTDSKGRAVIGNVTEATRLNFDVRAHGFQWWQWKDTSFESNGVINLVLKRARPVSLKIVDENDGSPIEGCRVFCRERSGVGNTHMFGYQLMPEMSAVPSGRDGLIDLDICRDEERYQTVVESPGYAWTLIDLTPDGSPQVVKLKPECRLSVLVKVPDEMLKKASKWHADLTVNINGYSLQPTQHVRVVEGEISFEFGHLPAGECNLMLSGHSDLKFNLTEPVTNLVLVSDGKKLQLVSGNGRSIKNLPPKMRTVKVVMRPPDGVPPVNAEISVRVAGERQKLRIRDNQATMEVDASAHVEFTPLGLAGLTFTSRRVEFHEKDEPLVLELPLMRAGAVSGLIDFAKGRPHAPVSGTVIMLDNSDVANNWRPSSGADSTMTMLNGSSKYFASPLLLGRQYRIRLSSGNTLGPVNTN